MTMQEFSNQSRSSKKNDPKRITGDLDSSEKELIYRRELESIFMEISSRFMRITRDTIDSEIEYSLSRIGKFIKADRGNIFIFDKNRTTFSNSYEWCASGIEPKKEAKQRESTQSFPWFTEKLLANEIVNISRVCDLPPEAEVEKNALEMQAVISALAAPVSVEGRLYGYIGFDSVKNVRAWMPETIALVKMISNIIAITLEKLNALEALEKSEKNFRTFFESIDEIVIVTDIEGRILFVNEAVEAKLGYRKDELLSTNVLDLNRGLNIKELELLRAAVFKSEKSYIPFTLVAKSGKLIPIEVHNWFGVWNNKECVYGIGKDMSAEQAARLKFERLFQHCPFPIALSLVSDGTFNDVNRAFLDTLGYTRDEVIGKDSYQIGIFIDPEHHKEVAERIAATGHISNEPFQVKCKDGIVLDGIFSGEILDIQGTKYFLTVMIDVTERNRMSELIEKERQRMASIIEGTNVGTWEWNIQTGETHYNERWAEIVGYSLDELSPLSIKIWMNLVHPDDLQKSDLLLARHFKGEIPFYDFDCRMKHKDGHWVWVHDRGRLITRDKEGNPLMMYGTHTDISDRKKTEEQLAEKNEQLQNEIQKRIRYTHALVHELKTPLTPIMNSSKLLAEHLEEGIMQKLAKNVYQGAGVLNNRVNELLELVRAEVGSLKIQRKSIDIAKLIDDTAAMLYPQISSKHQVLKIDLASPLPRIKADEERLRQVLMNLITNANKYCPPESLICLRARRNNNMIEIEVEDNGPGIAIKIQKHLFEPYYRGIHNNSAGGLGLGLSIAKNIVELHGGRMWVTSKKGKGSTFGFNLPYSKIKSG